MKQIVKQFLVTAELQRQRVLRLEGRRPTRTATSISHTLVWVHSRVCYSLGHRVQIGQSDIAPVASTIAGHAIDQILFGQNLRRAVFSAPVLQSSSDLTFSREKNCKHECEPDFEHCLFAAIFEVSAHIQQKFLPENAQLHPETNYFVNSAITSQVAALTAQPLIFNCTHQTVKGET